MAFEAFVLPSSASLSLSFSLASQPPFWLMLLLPAARLVLEAGHGTIVADVPWSQIPSLQVCALSILASWVSMRVHRYSVPLIPYWSGLQQSQLEDGIISVSPIVQECSKTGKDALFRRWGHRQSAGVQILSFLLFTHGPFIHWVQDALSA